MVVSLLTVVAAMTFLAPETAHAASRTVKKRAHVTVKPLVTLRNRPQTACRITVEGRKRYLKYLDVLERVVRDAAAAAKDDRAVPGHRGLART